MPSNIFGPFTTFLSNSNHNDTFTKFYEGMYIGSNVDKIRYSIPIPENVIVNDTGIVFP